MSLLPYSEAFWCRMKTHKNDVIMNISILHEEAIYPLDVIDHTEELWCIRVHVLPSVGNPQC